MRIGIDLDGVIFDSEKLYRVYSELFDTCELKRNSIIDEQELKFQERYNWTEEEKDLFMQKYHKKIVEESNFMPGAIEVLKMLKNEGNEFILITARGGIRKDMIPITEKRLKSQGLLFFDKYYWGTKNKDEICTKENIDIMIDDYIENCKMVANSNIKTIYLKDAPSYEAEENENIITLYNWGEIYRYFKELKNN